MNRETTIPTDWPHALSPATMSGSPDGRPEAPPLNTLGDMLGVMGTYWRSLGLWLMACLAAGVWYLHVTPPEYSASATVILEPHRQIGTLDGAGSIAPQMLDSAQAESQIQVMRSERILASVFDLLHLQDAPELAPHGTGLKTKLLSAFGLGARMGDDPANAAADARVRAFQAFSDRVGVRRIGQSYVLDVSYRAGSPGQAARIANAVTSAYILAQIDLKVAAAHNGSEYLQERIADIKAEQEAAIDGIRQGRIPATQFPDVDARVIGAALRPLAKSSPQTTLVLVFTLSVGFLTGLLTIAVSHALDRTLSARAQVCHALGLDCLGSLPYSGRRYGLRGKDRTAALGRAVITDPASSFAQAVRSARTAILLQAPTGRRCAIGLVSWSPGEGRTTFASNLAHLMAVSGEAVALIDGDLCSPSLTMQLAPKAPAGLNEALLNHVGVSRMTSVQITESLSFVPAVAAGFASEPNIFLGSAEMQALLNGLISDQDIIIDLPPLAFSSDAQAISPFLDGVVLIVEAGRTTMDEALDALRVLQVANARVLGVVLNKTTSAKSRVRPVVKRRASSVRYLADRRGLGA